MVSHCDIYSNHMCNQQKEPLMTYEIPSFTWEFTHTTLSPYHSQSKDKAELAVKIVKKLTAKAIADNHNLQLTILDWVTN